MTITPTFTTQPDFSRVNRGSVAEDPAAPAGAARMVVESRSTSLGAGCGRRTATAAAMPRR